MKKLIYLLLAIAAMISSCKKAALKASDSGCISQAPFTRLSATDSITVAGLMKSNNLSTGGLAFNAYQSYTTTGANSQQVQVQIATASQIRNNMPLFFYDVNYAFDNGITDGNIPSLAGNVSLDNKPTFSLHKGFISQ